MRRDAPAPFLGYEYQITYATYLFLNDVINMENITHIQIESEDITLYANDLLINPLAANVSLNGINIPAIDWQELEARCNDILYAKYPQDRIRLHLLLGLLICRLFVRQKKIDVYDIKNTIIRYFGEVRCDLSFVQFVASEYRNIVNPAAETRANILRLIAYENEITWPHIFTFLYTRLAILTEIYNDREDKKNKSYSALFTIMKNKLCRNLIFCSGPKSLFPTYHLRAMYSRHHSNVYAHNIKTPFKLDRDDQRTPQILMEYEKRGAYVAECSY